MNELTEQVAKRLHDYWRKDNIHLGPLRWEDLLESARDSRREKAREIIAMFPLEEIRKCVEDIQPLVGLPPIFYDRIKIILTLIPPAPDEPQAEPCDACGRSGKVQDNRTDKQKKDGWDTVHLVGSQCPTCKGTGTQPPPDLRERVRKIVDTYGSLDEIVDAVMAEIAGVSNVEPDKN